MKVIQDISKIFKECCSNDFIKDYNNIKLREKHKGVSLISALFYRFKYTDISTTKQKIVSYINNLNGYTISRQAFDSKDNNISINFYRQMYLKIINYFNLSINGAKNDPILPLQDQAQDPKIVAIDGVFSHDDNQILHLNLGIFDVTNNVPLDITFNGSKKKNEVKLFIKYVKSNMEKFKNVIFVCDRLYYNVDLIQFLLNTPGIKFIIRVRGDGANWNINIPLKKNVKSRTIINSLRDKVRVVKSKNIFTQMVTMYKKNKKIITKKITIKPDCVLLTNLNDLSKYPDKILFEMYKSRWDIEVFFKLIKNNFKFQQMKEKDSNNYKKMYYCELIITYLMKLIENDYWKDKKPNKVMFNKDGQIKECVEKINKSNLIGGIFDKLLELICFKEPSDTDIENFYNSYIILTKNETNRSYPRTSKTRYSKWYTRTQYDIATFTKIINAITNRTVDKLDNKSKKIAKMILSIEKG